MTTKQQGLNAAVIYARRRAEAQAQQASQNGARTDSRKGTRPLPKGAVLRTLPLPAVRFES